MRTDRRDGRIRPPWVTGLLLVCLASARCEPGGLVLMADDDDAADDDVAVDDDDTDADDDTTGDDDTSDDDTADDDTDDPSEYAGCSFESGELTGFGHPGWDWAVSDEGGMLAIVGEGDNFSGLVGEEALSFTGDHAALLRSDEAADPDTWGHLITDPFVPVVPTLIFDQLSEVDDRGVELDVAILDEQGNVLQQQSLPVETGGFVPGLPPGGVPLADFPEIVTGGEQPGDFVRGVIDLTPYWQTGEAIQVRFRARTTVEGNGFFTLLDNVCNMEP